MNKGKNGVRLYNVLFPLWFILLVPQLWAAVLPANFIIDSLVLLLGMLALRMEQRRTWYKRCILWVFIFGLLSDVIGSIYMIAMLYMGIGSMGDEPILTIPAILIAAVLIFLFDYFVSFRKMHGKERLILSLAFAVLTAPYTFLVPSSWLY